MAEKRLYWLKLENDFFTKNKEVKKLRKIAGGDTYTIIYLKMMLLALDNGGYLYHEGIEEDFADELALSLDEDEDNVKVTLSFLESCHLIEEIEPSKYFLNQVPCMTGEETAAAGRMRKLRAAKKEQAFIEEKEPESQKETESGEDEKTKECNNVRDCYGKVTECSQTLPYIDIEKEIDIDINTHTSKLPPEPEKDPDPEEDLRKDPQERVNYKEIADLYNKTCKSFPKVMKMTSGRKKKIRSIIKAYSLEDLKKVFEKAENSRFLKGNGSRGWTANFDWLITEANVVKVLEGNYDNRASPGEKFQGFEQRNTSFDELEGMLLEN